MAIKDNILHQRLVLDVNSTDSLNVVEMKQGDKSSRFVDIILVASGEPIDISTLVGEGGKAKTIASMKGELRQNDEATINKEDNSITVEMSENALGEAGNLDCEIRLTDSSGSVLSSALFIVRVGRSAAGKNGGVVDISKGSVHSDHIAEDAIEEKHLSAGSVTPNILDRSYWERRTSVDTQITTTDALFDATGFVGFGGSIAFLNVALTVNVGEISVEFENINGFCYAIGVKFVGFDTVYLINVTDGTQWKINRYNEGSELVPIYRCKYICLGLREKSVTPDMLDRKYLERCVTEYGEEITSLAELEEKIGMHINRGGHLGFVKLNISDSENETITNYGYINGDFMAVGSLTSGCVNLFNLGNGENWVVFDMKEGKYTATKVDTLTPRVEYLENNARFTFMGMINGLSELRAYTFTKDRVYHFYAAAEVGGLVGNGYCYARYFTDESDYKMLEVFNSSTLKVWKLNVILGTAELLSGGLITPEKLDRTYWEYAKSSFVESASGLLDMLTEENKIMRIKALKDSSMYYWLGDDDALALKTNEGFFVINLCNGKKYKFDPEGGGLEEVESVIASDSVVSAGTFRTLYDLKAFYFEENKLYKIFTPTSSELANLLGASYGQYWKCIYWIDRSDGDINYLTLYSLDDGKSGTLALSDGKYRGHIDQTYNPESENAQSGKAVAEAIESVNDSDSVVSAGTFSTLYDLKAYYFEENKLYKIFTPTSSELANLLGASYGQYWKCIYWIDRSDGDINYLTLYSLDDGKSGTLALSDGKYRGHLVQGTENNLTAEQVNALDAMFKKCAFVSDASAEYEAFKAAFGLTESGSEPEAPDTPTEPDTSEGETVTVNIADLEIKTGYLLKKDGTESAVSVGGYVSFPYHEGMFISVYNNTNWAGTYPPFMVYDNGEYIVPEYTHIADTLGVYEVTLKGYSIDAVVYVNINMSSSSYGKYSYYTYES